MVLIHTEIIVHYFVKLMFSAIMQKWERKKSFWNDPDGRDGEAPGGGFIGRILGYC